MVNPGGPTKVRYVPGRQCPVMNGRRSRLGGQLNRCLNCLRKKRGGSLSVCGADVFHRWRSEFLPVDLLRVSPYNTLSFKLCRKRGSAKPRSSQPVRSPTGLEPGTWLLKEKGFPLSGRKKRDSGPQFGLGLLDSMVTL